MSLRAFKDRQIFWTVSLFALVAAVADAVVAQRADRLGRADVLRVFASSAAWAVLVSAAAFSLLVLCGWLVSLLAKDPEKRGRLMIAGASVPVIVALVLGGLDLLSGPGISGKSWAGAARVAWVVAAIGGGLLFARLAPSLPRALAWILAPPFLLAALWADRRVYPKLYPVAHLLLWLSIFVAVALVAATLAASARPRTRTLGGIAALLLGWSVIALVFWDPLFDAPVARAAAYRETLFLKRALTHLMPARKTEALDPDPEVVRSLRAASTLDAALLDQALPDRRRMNVVLISIDAVRADRLSRNGYSRRLLPNLEALVAGGVYFTNAWTTFPFTLMAFGSAFRGVYASATDPWRYREAGFDRLPWAPQPTLASILRSRGWRTEAVVGFPRFVREILQREEGFQHFNAHADPRWNERSYLAEEVTTLAIDALDRDPGSPFFLWVHYFDPHAPYEPPPPHPFGEARPDLYDTEIQYADRELGRFLDAMRARRLFSNTAIVFFSDHGEDLHEFDHGTSLDEINIHVPFAIVLPRVPAKELPVAVDLTDVAPTILDLLGIEKPPHFDGQSLLAPVLLDVREGGAAGVPDLAFSEIGGAKLPQARQFAARSGRLKIICHVASQTYSLFDLATDPNESRDLSRDEPDALARMKRVLDSFQSLIAEVSRTTTRKPDSREPK